MHNTLLSLSKTIEQELLTLCQEALHHQKQLPANMRTMDYTRISCLSLLQWLGEQTLSDWIIKTAYHENLTTQLRYQLQCGDIAIEMVSRSNSVPELRIITQHDFIRESVHDEKIIEQWLHMQWDHVEEWLGKLSINLDVYTNKEIDILTAHLHKKEVRDG
jgi:hypothetical protein